MDGVHLFKFKQEDGVMSGPTSIIQKKARRQWITGKPTFQWNEEKQMHVRTAEAPSPKASQTDTARSIAEEAFGNHAAMMRKDLAAAIVAIKGGKTESADSLIGRWHRLGVIRQTILRGQWELVLNQACLGGKPL